MVAHVMDEARVQVQRVAQRTASRDRSPDRGRVARQIVAGWDAGQRARARASLLQLRRFGDGAGEMELIALIDQAERR